jgi:hypothetical protein
VAKPDETLSSDIERAKAALMDVVGDKITLQPDRSGRFLIAEFGLESASLTCSGRDAGKYGSGGLLFSRE